MDLGLTISIQEFRVEPESIVYDRSYGLEPEDMVLEVRARGYDKSLGGSQRI